MTRARTKTIRVEVSACGRAIVPITLELGSTVEDALRAAGHTLVSGEEVSVDDETVRYPMETELEDNDIVVIAPKSKGA